MSLPYATFSSSYKRRKSLWFRHVFGTLSKSVDIIKMHTRSCINQWACTSTIYRDDIIDGFQNNVIFKTMKRQCNKISSLDHDWMAWRTVEFSKPRKENGTIRSLDRDWMAWRTAGFPKQWRLNDGPYSYAKCYATVRYVN
jgi:hypothetical protein